MRTRTLLVVAIAAVVVIAMQLTTVQARHKTSRTSKTSRSSTSSSGSTSNSGSSSSGSTSSSGSSSSSEGGTCAPVATEAPEVSTTAPTAAALIDYPCLFEYGVTAIAEILTQSLDAAGACLPCDQGGVNCVGCFAGNFPIPPLLPDCFQTT